LYLSSKEYKTMIYGDASVLGRLLLFIIFAIANLNFELL
jgi:hypothetical protein